MRSRFQADMRSDTLQLPVTIVVMLEGWPALPYPAGAWRPLQVFNRGGAPWLFPGGFICVVYARIRIDISAWWGTGVSGSGSHAMVIAAPRRLEDQIFHHLLRRAATKDHGISMAIHPEAVMLDAFDSRPEKPRDVCPREIGDMIPDPHSAMVIPEESGPVKPVPSGFAAGARMPRRSDLDGDPGNLSLHRTGFIDRAFVSGLR